ncbi:YbbR family protein [Desulfovibrio sp. X2]|uniref:CdaR family protein n=1 Tax=Desulfovibrio sp. X2 TaxID=941449 RepID=UPI000358AC5A|nr:CdaR family protein [Desulfovibrio sp. X2]EPR42767.1 YbbR family protein [Desulfovibrio sp. X2]
MRNNWQYMILALVLAVISWYLVSGRERVETWIEVPVVTTNTPKGLVVLDGVPAKLEVRIRGPRGLVRTVNAADLTYILNLSGIQAGENNITLNSSNVPLSGALSPLEIKPARLTVTADALVSKTVPVRPDWEGDLPSGWELKQASATPAEVKLTGPKSVLDGVSFVETKAWQVDPDSPNDISGRRPIKLPDGTESDPAQVGVHYVFGPRTVQLWARLAVEKPDSPANVVIAPGQVRVRLELPESLAQSEKFRKEIRVTLAPGTDFSSGRRDASLAFDLPRWTKVLEVRPDKVHLTIPKAAEARKAPASAAKPK